jgi:hypothetical protein
MGYLREPKDEGLLTATIGHNFCGYHLTGTCRVDTFPTSSGSRQKFL